MEMSRLLYLVVMMFSVLGPCIYRTRRSAKIGGSQETQGRVTRNLLSSLKSHKGTPQDPELHSRIMAAATRSRSKVTAVLEKVSDIPHGAPPGCFMIPPYRKQPKTDELQRESLILLP
ncbi:hypothetical protein RRG08_033535 [Elysia crispata]|uniref:Uncharacterized protein n=1 Tax=Elysia crispata TaxID=231223 RepID=A0AAE0XNX9_9GAST|nr:hypothetical protein RRG08_033535 [Elysia crispata]